jgi:hypothetical protein
MLSLFAFLSGAQLAAAACNRDNCLRAVTGENQTRINRIFTVSTSDILLASAFPQRQGSADCASFFLHDATGIPAYASACSSSVRYSSACSCIGITNTLPNVISITSSTTSSTTVSTSTSSTSLSTACTTTTTMTSTTSTFLTTTRTTTSTTATTSSPPLSGWVDLGCYEDLENDIFSGAAQKTSYPTPFTLQFCATECAGFINFAVRASLLCVCFDYQYYIYEINVPQSSCVVPCLGDPTTYCGGTGFYEFYQLDSVS